MIIDERSLFNIRKSADMVLVVFSFFVAAIIAQPIQELLTNFALFFLLLLQVVIWYLSSSLLNTYNDFNYFSFPSQIINLTKLVIIQTVFTIFFLFFVKENLFTRNFLALYTIILFIVVISKEYLIWSSHRKYRKMGKGLRNMVIVGFNSLSCKFQEQIEDEPGIGFNFIGYVDDCVSEHPKYIGNFDELEKINKKEKISDLIYCRSLDDQSMLDKAVAFCDKHAIKLTLLPHLDRFSNTSLEIEFLGNFPVIKLRRNKLEELQWRIIKRTFDIVIVILLLLFVLWWVYLIIMISIKFSSKGKIFFVQKRLGRHSKIFNCYKFRTMKEAGNNSGTTGFKDEMERVTKIGKVLRKYSLDEVPQFINVLKGDMSIVGPRPHAISYNDIYSEMVDEIKLRHRIKPGITGWAQIHGLRGDVDDMEKNKIRAKKRIDFDNWYIENWSLKLDVQIFIETTWQIITKKNLGT